MPPWMPGPDSAALVGRDVRRLTAGELDDARRVGGGRRARGRPGDRHTNPSVRRPRRAGRTITLVAAEGVLAARSRGWHRRLPLLPARPEAEAERLRDRRADPPAADRQRPPRDPLRGRRRAGDGSDAAERAHGGKGWSCFGGPDLPVDLNATGAIDRLGQPPWIAAWVPGHTSNALPAGTGVLLHKGAKIVMQVHYNLIAGTGPDRSRAQLRLRPASTKLTALETHLVAAPVELPCPSGSSGPKCSRAQAFQDEITKYGVQNALHPDRAAAALREDARRLPAGRRRRHARSRPRAIARSRAHRRSTASRATCTCAARTSPSCSTRGRRRSRRSCTSRRGTSTGRTSTT